MIDLTTILSTLADKASAWTFERGVEVVEMFRSAVPGTVDWDDVAGEDWARIIASGNIAALVGIRWPIVLVSEQNAPQLRRLVPNEVAYVVVSDFDDPQLTASEESLFTAFGDRARSAAFTPGIFSANDLWFATV